MPDSWPSEQASPRERAAGVAREARSRTEAGCQSIFRQVVAANPGNPEASGMAAFYRALLDLVEEHVRSEVEETLTWARPRQDELDAAFRALLLEALRAALGELGDAVEPRAEREELR